MSCLIAVLAGICMYVSGNQSLLTGTQSNVLDQSKNEINRLYYAPEFSSEQISATTLDFSDSSIAIQNSSARVNVPVWLLRDTKTFKQYFEMSLVPVTSQKLSNRVDTELGKTSEGFSLYERKYILGTKQESISVYAEKTISADAKLTIDVPWGNAVIDQLSNQQDAINFVKEFSKSLAYNEKILNQISLAYTKISTSENKDAISKSLATSDKQVQTYFVLSLLSQSLSSVPYTLYKETHGQLIGICSDVVSKLNGLPTAGILMCNEDKDSAAFYVQVNKNTYSCNDTKGIKRIVTTEQTKKTICE